MGRIFGVGRPSTYSDELVSAICQRIAAGESLRSVCRDEGMPSKTTVMRWLADERYESFRDHYARAVQVRADYLTDEILEIADDGVNDTYQTERGEATNFDHIQRSKLRVDTRKWLMSKMVPRKYGDRVGLEHSTPDGPLSIRWQTDGD